VCSVTRFVFEGWGAFPAGRTRRVEPLEPVADRRPAHPCRPIPARPEPRSITWRAPVGILGGSCGFTARVLDEKGGRRNGFVASRWQLEKPSLPARPGAEKVATRPVSAQMRSGLHRMHHGRAPARRESIRQKGRTKRQRSLPMSNTRAGVTLRHIADPQYRGRI